LRIQGESLIQRVLGTIDKWVIEKRGIIPGRAIGPCFGTNRLWTSDLAI
jgi:hypothetical protein